MQKKQKKERRSVLGTQRKPHSGHRSEEQENPFIVELPSDTSAEDKITEAKDVKETKTAEQKAAKKLKKQEKRQSSKEKKKSASKKKVKYEGGISGDLIYIILMTIAIAAALFFSMTVFFKVSSIEVSGNERISSTEIRAASGIEDGDRMLFLNRFEIRDRIFASIPYVDEIRIRQYPPNKVVLEVTECEPVAAVSSGSIYYLIDAKAKLLEYFPITGPSAYPVITGLDVQTQELGKTLDLGDELRIVSLKSVVDSLATDPELCKEIGEINMEKLYDVSFTYDGRLKVNLGEADKLSKKLKLFKEVLTKLERTDKGTIGLKKTDSVTFLPD